MMLRTLTSTISIICMIVNFSSLADGAMQFSLPKDDKVVCTDSMDNVCTAPTSCNKNGKAVLDTGNNFNVGAATQDNGVWLIQGGYTIDFPSLCNVTCQGNCTCETCTMIEVDDFVTDDGKLISKSSTDNNLTPKSTAYAKNRSINWTTIAMADESDEIAILALKKNDVDYTSDG